MCDVILTLTGFFIDFEQPQIYFTLFLSSSVSLFDHLYFWNVTYSWGFLSHFLNGPSSP